MSGSNHCFLICIQVSQEAGKVVWFSHLLKNFPQFVVIHTVKGFSVVKESEVDVFIEFSCFFYDPTDVGNLISGSSPFSKSSLNIWKFSVHILLKPSLENFEYNSYSFSLLPVLSPPSLIFALSSLYPFEWFNVFVLKSPLQLSYYPQSLGSTSLGR